MFGRMQTRAKAGLAVGNSYCFCVAAVVSCDSTLRLHYQAAEGGIWVPRSH